MGISHVTGQMDFWNAEWGVRSNINISSIAEFIMNYSFEPSLEA